jgi:hypothetical protein
MAKRDAPQLGQVAVISRLVEPRLGLDIVQVLAHDTDHNAWKVGVCVRTDEPQMRGVHPTTNATLWVKAQRAPWPHDMATEWVLYDMETALPAEVHP